MSRDDLRLTARTIRQSSPSRSHITACFENWTVLARFFGRASWNFHYKKFLLKMLDFDRLSLTFVKTMVTTRESRAMAVRNWMNWIIIAWTQCSVVDLEPYPIVVWPSRANRNAVVKSKTWSTHVLCSSYVPSFQAVISPFCHAINQYISPNNNQRPEVKISELNMVQLWGSYKLVLARWR